MYLYTLEIYLCLNFFVSIVVHILATRKSVFYIYTDITISYHALCLKFQVYLWFYLPFVWKVGSVCVYVCLWREKEHFIWGKISLVFLYLIIYFNFISTWYYHFIQNCALTILFFNTLNLLFHCHWNCYSSKFCSFLCKTSLFSGCFQDFFLIFGFQRFYFVIHANVLIWVELI